MSKYYQCCKFNFTHGNQHSVQDRVFTKSYQCFSYLKFNIVHGNKDTRHPKKKKKIIMENETENPIAERNFSNKLHNGLNTLNLFASKVI